MVFTNITPFPYEMGALTNVAPLTYRDSTTFSEKLEAIAYWLNDTLVPNTNVALADAIEEFQTGIANAEATVTTAKNGWQATFNEFKTLVESALAAAVLDVSTTKEEWQTTFNAFMADVEAELAALNDSAVAGLLLDPESDTGTALDTAVLREAVGRGEQFFNVKDYGAVGDGVTNDIAAIQSAATAAGIVGGTVYFPPAHRFRVNSQIDFSAAVKPVSVYLPASAAIVVGADVSAIVAKGVLNPVTKALTNSTVVNGRTIVVDDSSWFAVDETVLIVSTDVVPNTVENEKMGVMRTILSIANATTANIDIPFYRVMNTGSAVRAMKAAWHPGINIYGGGLIEGLTQTTSKQTLIRCEIIKNAHVSVSLGNNGGPGVTFSHADGFSFNGVIRNLKDDINNGYVGYGVNVGGTSRNGEINGKGVRCRHAFTTNTAPTLGGEFHGEPEKIRVRMVTERCSNKAIDTHRPGWDIDIHVSDFGSFGGLQIRCDNVTASGTISGTYDSGVNVSSLVTVPPVLHNFTIVGSGGADGNGMAIFAPTRIGKLVTRNCRIGLRIEANDCSVDRADTSGNANNSGAGVTVLGNNNIIRDMEIDTAGTGLVENAGSTGNYFGKQKFTNCGVNRSLQAYTHEVALRTNERVAATAVGPVTGVVGLKDSSGNIFGYVAVSSTATIT